MHENGGARGHRAAGALAEQGVGLRRPVLLPRQSLAVAVVAHAAGAPEDVGGVVLGDALDDPVGLLATVDGRAHVYQLVNQAAGAVAADQRPIAMHEQGAGARQSAAPHGVVGGDNQQALGEIGKHRLDRGQGPAEEGQGVLQAAALAGGSGHPHVGAGDHVLARGEFPQDQPALGARQAPAGIDNHIVVFAALDLGVGCCRGPALRQTKGELRRRLEAGGRGDGDRRDQLVRAQYRPGVGLAGVVAAVVPGGVNDEAVAQRGAVPCGLPGRLVPVHAER